jgi:hypothetical protein
MTPGRLQAGCAAAVLLVAGATNINGVDATAPRDLLARLPVSTNLTVVPLEGALAPAPGVERWRLFVNDAQVFESSSSHGTSNVLLGIGLILRLGDNLIALESVGAGPRGRAARPLERWTTHIQRNQPIGVRQFAVLAQGDATDSASRDRIDRFRRAIIDNGVPAANIRDASSWEKLADTLSELGKEAAGRDQVLIYYSGSGRVSRVNTEPELVFSRAEQSSIPSLPVGNLIREAGALPSASVLLDITYSPPASGAPPPRLGARPSTFGAAAPWLGTIGKTSSVEVAYTNPFTDAARSGNAGFTRDFIDALPSTSPGDEEGCRTFASVAQSVARRNSQKPDAAWPVFHALMPSSFRFCAPTVARRTRLLPILPSPSIGGSPALRFVEVRVPATGTTSELLVDGVPVPLPRPTAGNTDATIRRVPIGAGRHILDLLSPVGASAPVMSGGTGTAAQEMSSRQWSAELTAELQRLTIPDVTSDSSVALSFIVADSMEGPIQYEVRNNGVVVLHDVVKTSSRPPRRQIVGRIPLALGTNNIALDVMRADRFSSARASLIRRRAQPVRAVIAGVDAPAGGVPLAAAEADARRMNDLLLRYTDAVPARIRLLVGSDATKKAILDAIAELGPPARTSLPAGASDDTFLLYFAGYGLSLDDLAGGGVRRCVLASDFDPARASETCLSTTELDSALETVGRALVIVDTSYDGRAGEHSRTYRTYAAPDTTWRLTSGTEHPDRTFLVASGSNSAAREAVEGGLFTVALDTAIRRHLDKPASNGPRELSLLEAYERAREETAMRSERRQIPVMKGVLSAPFVFVPKPIDELKQEAAGIERAARNDLAAMRALDAVRLARASRLYDKILNLDAADSDARLGRARVRLLANDLSGTRQAVDEGLRLAADLTSPAAANWMLVRAELKMRLGDLDGAIADTERASAGGSRSPAPAALRGMLYGAIGEPDKSLALLQPLLLRQTSEEGALTDEDLGRILLHTYLNLRRSGQRVNARILLETFLNTAGGRNLLKRTYQNPVIERLVPALSRIVSMGEVGVQALWSHVVAEFLLQGAKYEPGLRAFQRDVEPYDPRDRTAFECLLHFYVGMARALDGDVRGAGAELQQAVDTGRTEYVEYWFARSELRRLKG